ncbi:MAG: sec-independent protein translocase protein TatB [Candidatus Azotimanducaceae bacterium]|jgi:sec-independent protein translocase protein TatB|tara:strand:- start:2602 stop:3114 length:513 start_codon:yes stop_codon:yes gene_type:complete
MFDGISTIETMVIIVVILLVIGPERLPETLRTLGLWVGRLQRSFTSVKTEIEKEIDMDGIRRQLHNEAVMEEMRRIEEEVKSGTDVLSQQTAVDANSIMSDSTGSAEEDATGSNNAEQSVDSSVVSQPDVTATNPTEDQAEHASTPPRTDAEVEAAYLRKQASLNEDKTN